MKKAMSSLGLCILLSLTSISAVYAQQSISIVPLKQSQLPAEIEQVIKKSPVGSGKVGVIAQYVNSDAPVFDRFGSDLMTPASNNKLLTTAAGLYYLGTDYKYNTRLCTNGQVEGNVLNGDLIFIGSGDPSINARFSPDKKDATAVFKEWADVLKKNGITVINGNVIADDDYFDDQYFLDTWYPKERAEWYEAEISAVVFNDNCVDINYCGGNNVGDPVSFSFSPDTDYIELTSEIKTTEHKYETIDMFRDDGSNKIRATGNLGVNEKKTRSAAVYNPTLYTALILQKTLTENGVFVKGHALDIDDLKKKEAYKNGLKTVVVHQSPDLIDIVHVINRKSQNLYADLLFKTMGRIEKETGSFVAGSKAVTDYLKAIDVYQPGHVMVDGSGLSDSNKVSPSMFAGVINHAHNTKYWKEFRYSLPQGTVRGGLKGRFKATPKDRFLGKFVYAKTGYIDYVATLSGVISVGNGQDLVFSVMINDYECSYRKARDTIDDIVVVLAQYAYTNQK